MKFIVDNFVPYVEEALSPYGQVVALHANDFTPQTVADADALIVRTRTKCNRELLEHSNVKFVGTATIGYDHIDRLWCQQQGIKVCSAAGCNARGVLQWVAAALAEICKVKGGGSPEGLTVGVVGVGHVGSLVVEYCRSWGFRVLCSDPPRELAEGLTAQQGFVPLNQLLSEADIVTLHTPLVRDGKWPTYHLANHDFVAQMKQGATLLNASRGEVADTQALIDGAHKLTLGIDVWEGEPSNLNPTLLELATIATPHIAGYSTQGKANASAIIIRAIAQEFNIEPLAEWYPENTKPSAPHPINWQEMCSQIEQFCDLKAETTRLKNHPEEFELRRNTYPLREEFF